MGMSDIKTMDDARQEIRKHLLRRGSYTHNLLGMVLRDCDKKFGRAFVNNLIDEFDLEYYGINKEPEGV
jgi:hypothetical protein